MSLITPTTLDVDTTNRTPQQVVRDVLAGSQWVRLRSEGARATLTLKQVTDATSIHGTTEIETEVGDLHAMAEILTDLGLREVRYQEYFREEWRLGDVAFDFDTWPDLPTFLEIEGPDDQSVRQAAARHGLDPASREPPEVPGCSLGSPSRIIG